MALLAIGAVLFGVHGFALGLLDNHITIVADASAQAEVQRILPKIEETRKAAETAQADAKRAADASDHYVCITVDQRPKAICDCEYRHRDKLLERRQYLCSQAGTAERVRIENDEGDQ